MALRAGQSENVPRRKAVRFRNAGSRSPEHQIQTAFVSWYRLYLKGHPAYQVMFTVPNGAKTGRKEGAKLLKEGMAKGAPDWCCLWPSACGTYPGLCIEFKAPGGVVKPHQRAFLIALKQAGYRVAVCYSASAAAALLLDYLGLEPVKTA